MPLGCDEASDRYARLRSEGFDFPALHSSIGAVAWRGMGESGPRRGLATQGPGARRFGHGTNDAAKAANPIPSRNPAVPHETTSVCSKANQTNRTIETSNKTTFT